MEPSRSESIPQSNARGHDEGQPPGMPRWVKLSLIIVAALVLGFVLLQLVGLGGQHGPGMHGAAP